MYEIESIFLNHAVLITFPLQQWLQERASLLRHSTLHLSSRLVFEKVLMQMSRT